MHWLTAAVFEQPSVPINVENTPPQKFSFSDTIHHFCLNFSSMGRHATLKRNNSLKTHSIYSIYIQSPKLIYGTSRFQDVGQNPCSHRFPSHPSARIVFLPTSTDSDMLDSCFHIHKENLFSLLLKCMVCSARRSPLFCPENKVCRDTSSQPEARRCNRSLIHQVTDKSWSQLRDTPCSPSLQRRSLCPG